MNILFLSLIDFNPIEERGIYPDLLRELKERGNNIYIVCPVERRYYNDAVGLKEDGVEIVKLKIGNIQKTNIIEKGISTLLIESQFISCIKKHFSGVKFDLVLYPTPPITFSGAVEYVKRRDGAKAYLMLKDIFPQNAVDLGMLSRSGVKGFLYKRFLAKEKRLYEISDRIGCMSQANVDYVLEHNPWLDADKVEIFPNCIEAVDKSVSSDERDSIRKKYGIPLDKKVFVYGGNLGRPQSVPFIIECMKRLADSQAYFLIVGDGTDYGLLESYVRDFAPSNVRLMQRLPKEDYDTLVGACDVGMIFLDYRFTIPNFPSRLLSYMQAKLPVLAVTDMNTDIGEVITDNGFGWWCGSDDADNVAEKVEEILKADLSGMGEKAFETLEREYDVRVWGLKLGTENK